MKYFIIIILFCNSFNSFCQKLWKNEVDEFKGYHVKETTSSALFSKGLFTSGTSYVRKVDNICSISVIYVRPEQIFSVNKNAELIFLLEDKSTYTLNALETVVADATVVSTATSWGANIPYVNYDDVCFEKLNATKITKLRMYLSDGYVEFEVKPKNALFLANAINLINK